MIILCHGVFQRELAPLLNNLYEDLFLGVGIFSLMWSLTLRMLLRFMLLEDLKLCTRVIDSNANASNLKNKVEFFLGYMKHLW